MVQKQISITMRVDTQLDRLRNKYADYDGKPISYSRIITKIMQQAGVWKKNLKTKQISTQFDSDVQLESLEAE